MGEPIFLGHACSAHSLAILFFETRWHTSASWRTPPNLMIVCVLFARTLFQIWATLFLVSKPAGQPWVLLAKAPGAGEPDGGQGSTEAGEGPQQGLGLGELTCSELAQ